jgi:hypothetical protein
MIRCPETNEFATVKVDAWHAAATSVFNDPHLRLSESRDGRGAGIAAESASTMVTGFHGEGHAAQIMVRIPKVQLAFDW